MFLKREKELMFFGLSPNQRSFEGVGLFLTIYIGASLFAAVLSAPAYWGIEWLHSINPTDTTKWLLGKRIDVYYDRLRWAPIILGLPWMMKRCGLFSLSNLGLKLGLKSAGQFFGYFSFGLCLAAGIYALQYGFGISALHSDFSASKLLPIFRDAAIGACAVALLEEIVMRGLIMRSFYTAIGAMSGVVISSLFFAYKHFKVPSSIWNNLPDGGAATWDMGFFVAWYDTAGIAYTFKFAEFAGLFMFGVVLCLLYIKTKSLWPCVGFHSGLVFCMMVYREIFSRTANAAKQWLGGAGMTDGWLALILLTAISAYLIAACRKRQNGQ